MVSFYFFYDDVGEDVDGFLHGDVCTYLNTMPQTMKIEQKQKHGAIPLHHTPCVRFLVRGYSDQVPSLRFFEE